MYNNKPIGVMLAKLNIKILLISIINNIMSKKENNIGILDPEGVNNNPLTDQPYSDGYKKLAKTWSKFPAYDVATTIIQNIKDNQVILVVAGTGSGKTVLVPKFALHALNYDKKIAITLPKQLVAKSAAEFSAQTLDVRLGDEVAYQYKGSDREFKGNDKTKLFYATDGTIVAKLMNDPYLKEYDVVIVDEAHERKVQIDFLMYLLKNTVRLRPEFKLIIMSATINEQIFKAYFEEFKYISVNIGGKTNYPIKSIFLDQPIDITEYISKGYEIIKNIVNEDDASAPGAHDILFFVTSVTEAIDTCGKVNKDNINGYCIEVYSGMDTRKELIARDKDLYKAENNGKSRKLLIATPVAESSLTIEGIKYVIDSGYELSGYYDPIKDARVLEKKLITHAQAKQRMGRSGRTEPGVCYHLYTKEMFDKKMERFPEPNIRTTNIYGECLKLLADLTTVEKLVATLSEFIEPPRENYLHNALSQLRELKLIQDNSITDLGKTVAKLNMDPMAGVAVYCAYYLRCTHEVLRILSLLDASRGNLSDIFKLPSDIMAHSNLDDPNTAKRMGALNRKFNDAKETFKNKYGDHIALHKIMDGYIDHMDAPSKLDDFCYKNFLKKSTLIKAYNFYSKTQYSAGNVLKGTPAGTENTMTDEYDLIDRIVACFAFGFRLHKGFLHDKVYNTLKTKDIKLSRNSFLNFNANLPKQIVYNELFISGGKSELNINTAVLPKIEEIVDKLQSDLFK